MENKKHKIGKPESLDKIMGECNAMVEAGEFPKEDRKVYNITPQYTVQGSRYEGVMKQGLLNKMYNYFSKN